MPGLNRAEFVKPSPPAQKPKMKFSDHFGTSKLQESDLDLVVEQMHLCACANENNAGDEGGRSPTNHWTISLQLNVTRSVQVDMEVVATSFQRRKPLRNVMSAGYRDGGQTPINGV